MRLGKLLVTSLLFVCFSLMIAISGGDAFAVEKTSESAETLLAKLSDEQVRQMLIEELKKDLQPEQSQSLGEGIQGPGSPLEKLLSSIEDESEESEDRFEKLWANIPILLPDLYKVLVTL